MVPGWTISAVAIGRALKGQQRSQMIGPPLVLALFAIAGVLLATACVAPVAATHARPRVGGGCDSAHWWGSATPLDKPPEPPAQLVKLWDQIWAEPGLADRRGTGWMRRPRCSQRFYRPSHHQQQQEQRPQPQAEEGPAAAGPAAGSRAAGSAGPAAAATECSVVADLSLPGQQQSEFGLIGLPAHCGRPRVYPARIKTDDDEAALLAGFVFERDLQERPRRPLGWDETGTRQQGPCSRSGAHEWFGVGPDRCDDRGQVVRVVTITFGGREGDNSGPQSVPFELYGPAVGGLTALEHLQLDYTGLTGTIPAEVGSLLHLKVLVLSVTSISGTIPPQLGNLVKLERLQLARTKLTGTIPPMFGQLAELQWLWLQGSASISGTVPADLGRLQNLELLWLVETGISGTIPRFIAGSNSSLQKVDLSYTSISGTLPVSLCKAPRLSELNMRNCKLSGSGVPAHGESALTVKEWSSTLAVLDLSENELTTLPPTLPVNLSHLYLGRNPIAGNASALAAMLTPLDQLASFSVGFVTEIDFGQTRVQSPATCVEYAESACKFTFTLALFDRQNQPIPNGDRLQSVRTATVRSGCDVCPKYYTPICEGGDTSCDGKLHPIDGHQNCSRTAPMRGGAGGLTFSIDASWAQIPGPTVLSFFDSNGTEFFPQKDSDGTLIKKNQSHSQAQRLESQLRTIHWIRPTVCDKAAHQTLSGSKCACAADYYNASAHGILLCAGHEWSTGLEKIISERKRDMQCQPCDGKCATCEQGRLVVKAGWRFNSVNGTEIAKRIANATRGGAPLIAFQCPNFKVGATSRCPEIHISTVSAANRSLDCLEPDEHWTGRLCGACEVGTVKKNHGRYSTCVTCTTQSAAFSKVAQHLGMSSTALAIALVLVVVAVFGTARAMRHSLRQLKTHCFTNVKILLGLIQVLSLIQGVLYILFPPVAAETVHGLSVFTLDMKRVFQTECWVDRWLNRWLVSIVGGPLLAVSLVGGRFAWQKLNGGSGAIEAPNSAKAACFFLTMLLHPQISTQAFKLLLCRDLGPETDDSRGTDRVSILEADFSVECTSSEYKAYWVVAWLLVVFVAIGVPLVMLALLLHQGRLHHRRYMSALEEARGSTSQISVDGDGRLSLRGGAVVGTAAEHRYNMLAADFAFWVDEYRDECFCEIIPQRLFWGIISLFWVCCVYFCFAPVLVLHPANLNPSPYRVSAGRLHPQACAYRLAAVHTPRFGRPGPARLRHRRQLASTAAAARTM